MSNYKVQASITCLKICLILYNIVLWCLGILLLVFGIQSYISWTVFILNPPGSRGVITYMPFMFIAVGSVVIVVSFLACLCAIRGNPPLLLALTAFLMLLFVLGVATCVIGFIYRNSLAKNLLLGLNYTMNRFGSDSNSFGDINVNMLQSKHKCCGVENYTDWFKTPWAQSMKSVPLSCCRNDLTICHNMDMKPLDVEHIYLVGCHDKLVQMASSHVIVLVGGCIGITIIMLFGIGMTLTLSLLERDDMRNRMSEALI